MRITNSLKESIDTKDDALEFVNKLHELGFKINIGLTD